VRPLLLALLLVGCAEPPPAPLEGTPEALRLLAFVDASAVADAFADLAADSVAYDADLIVIEFEGDQEVGRETVTVQRRPTGSDLERSGTGTLADDPSEAPELRDPIAQALSDDPPFLDPVAGEAYRRTVLGDTTIGGTRFRLVEAVLTDTRSELGVRRVWAAVAEGGRVAAIEVERSARSAIFDEDSRVRVDLVPHAGGWVPTHITTDTQTDVPLSGAAHVRTEWRVRMAE
jgi:hypothetical protein